MPDLGNGRWAFRLGVRGQEHATGDRAGSRVRNRRPDPRVDGDTGDICLAILPYGRAKKRCFGRLSVPIAPDSVEPSLSAAYSGQCLSAAAAPTS